MLSFLSRFAFRREEYIFLLLVALYVGACWFVSIQSGEGDRFHPLMYMDRCVSMTFLLGFALVCYMVLKLFYIMVIIRPRQLFKMIGENLRRGPLNVDRIARAIPIFIGFLFFFSAFTSMKQMIPGIMPFSWDEEFAALDRLIHFGIDPWRILQPILGFPLITFIINVNYNAWLVFLFAALYWQLFTLANPQARMQFFYAFFFSWIINGTLLAIMMSSVGPCFLERLTGSGYYNELMDYLRHANEDYRIFAVRTQDTIWNAAVKGESMMGGGISAMPSIHVTSALLFWLLARDIKTKYEWMFKAFFFLILIGSVHLGWHYAVDGYIAIITTLAIWYMSGWILSKIRPIPQEA